MFLDQGWQVDLDKLAFFHDEFTADDGVIRFNGSAEDQGGERIM
jgi:hypothetical protein